MERSWLMQLSAPGGYFLTTDLGFYWASLVAQMVKCCLQRERPRFDPWVGRMPWRRKWQPTPALLPGKSYERRSLIGYSPWGCKESDTTEQLHSPSPCEVQQILFLPGGSVVESACQCKSHRRCGFAPWVGKILWRRKWQPIPVFLPRESHGQRSLVSPCPWGGKELDMTDCTH